MAIFTTTVSRALAFTALLVASLAVAKPAEATFAVTVGGNNYIVDTVGPPGKQSYQQAVTNNWMIPFDATPWWMNESQAISIAQQVAQQAALAVPALVDVSFRVPFRTASLNSERVYYGFAVNTGSTIESDDFNRTTANTNSNDGGFGATHHAWVTQVPEIDGPVLAQAIFVLGSLYLVIRGQVGRRRAIV